MVFTQTGSMKCDKIDTPSETNETTAQLTMYRWENEEYIQRHAAAATLSRLDWNWTAQMRIHPITFAIEDKNHDVPIKCRGTLESISAADILTTAVR